MNTVPPITKVCAWCKRVLVNGVYVVDSRHEYRAPYTHGICPECEAKTRQEWSLFPGLPSHTEL